MKIRDRKFAKLTTDELHDILKLRIDVFVAEQACAYPELDGRDTEPTTRHVWMADDVGVVAYVRVLHDDDHADLPSRHPGGRSIRRARWRPDRARPRLDRRALGARRPELSAGWYRKRGFEDDGEEFVEYGIAHLPMRRES